jgi:transposase
MPEFTRVAIDTSKHVFTIYGVTTADEVVRRELRRPRLLAFFEKMSPTEVVLEACAGSHHWGRELQALGHRVRLIPPQYVKPFVRRSKNDRNDAEAIWTAAAQPSIVSVPVKSVRQQAEAMLLKVREQLVRERTGMVNALRGHAMELGFVAAQGKRGLAELQQALATAADHEVPPAAKRALALLGRRIDQVETQLVEAEAELKRQFKADADSKRLSAAPGFGMINSLTMTKTVEFSQFTSGRHFAAWLGIVPREHSTGGKHRLGRISRAGNERLRALLVNGATAVIRHFRPGGKGRLMAWLEALLKRKPRKLAAVALANKMARIAWAMMTSGEAYRLLPKAG